MYIDNLRVELIIINDNNFENVVDSFLIKEPCRKQSENNIFYIHFALVYIPLIRFSFVL
jgi:hypothetical protein